MQFLGQLHHPWCFVVPKPPSFISRAVGKPPVPLESRIPEGFGVEGPMKMLQIQGPAAGREPWNSLEQGWLREALLCEVTVLWEVL